MRELVYLSEGKLRQFQPERKRRWRRPTLRGEVGIPGVGQFGAESAPVDTHLDEVIAHLEATARWYEDGDLQPGQWVQFEARLSYTVVTNDSGLSVLLFAQSPEDVPHRRLVLHGTPAHLAGQVPEPATMRWGGSGTPASASGVVRLLRRRPAKAAEEEGLLGTERNVHDLHDLLRRINGELDPAFEEHRTERRR